jgi:hypothetical protein
MAQSPNNLYAKILSQFGFGYPLWIPGPSTSASPAYFSRGVNIGDVGIKTRRGSFDFLFDASLPACDPINIDGVPDEFVPLLTQARSKDIDPDFFAPWTYIGERYVKDVNIQLAVSTQSP